MCGDRLAVRWGPSGLLVPSGLLATGGLGIALLIGHPAAAIAGFALLGAGVAPVVPVLFPGRREHAPRAELAGHRHGRVAGLPRG